MTSTPYKKRNLGLDIVRCVAILLVLVEHSHLYFIFGNQPGVWGVEIFFVLSGYLIGQIIIRSFSDGLTFGKIKEFWIRRWFRTLPMYFLVLIFLDLFLDPTGENHWKYYLFLQNFTEEFAFFPVSWSLTIEEWFYLLVPLLFLLIARKNRLHKQHVTLLLSGVVALIVIARVVYVLQVDPTFDLGVRKFPPLRLDALMLGVLLAHIKMNYRSLFEQLAKLPVFLAGLAGMASIAIFFYLHSASTALLDQSFVVRAFLFTLMSISFVLILPWMELQPTLNRLRDNHPIRWIVTNISLMTYTIYLIHFDIFYNLVKAPQFSLDWLWQTALSFVLTFALAAVLYRFIEKPATDLRERFSKKSRK